MWQKRRHRWHLFSHLWHLFDHISYFTVDLRLAHVTPSGVTSQNPHTLYTISLLERLVTLKTVKSGHCPWWGGGSTPVHSFTRSSNHLEMEMSTKQIHICLHISKRENSWLKMSKMQISLGLKQVGVTSESAGELLYGVVWLVKYGLVRGGKGSNLSCHLVTFLHLEKSQFKNSIEERKRR